MCHSSLSNLWKCLWTKKHKQQKVLDLFFFLKHSHSGVTLLQGEKSWRDAVFEHKGFFVVWTVALLDHTLFFSFFSSTANRDFTSFTFAATFSKTVWYSVDDLVGSCRPHRGEKHFTLADQWVDKSDLVFIFIYLIFSFTKTGKESAKNNNKVIQLS